MSHSCRMASPVRPMMRDLFAAPEQASSRTHSLHLLLRFGLIGLLNTAFGYMVFAVLVLAGVWAGAAIIVATIAGVAFNFQTSRRLVFRTHGRIFRFVALYGGVLALNWLALRALHATGLSDLISQALLVVPLACVSLFGQRALVFGPTAGKA